MSIKPQYESYRYTGEVACLHSQSIVECRLPGSEIGNILAVQAKAIPTECVCADGEVRYKGKLLLCVLYEDGDKKICRVERGAEFFHKAEGNDVTPACFAKVAFRADSVRHRREGSGVYVSVIVGADANVYGGRQMEYLVGGEDVVAKKQVFPLCRTLCVSGETEAEDEFDADYVGDVLLHHETAVVTHVAVAAGELHIEGELSLNVCVLKENDELCSYERLIPVRMSIPCEEAFSKVSASARLIVKSAHVTAGVDEERGKSKILFTYCLAADCFLHAQSELEVAIDAFSPAAELTLKKEKDEGMYLSNMIKCTERVTGIASLSPAIEGEYALQAAICPRAEIVCRQKENGAYEAEGVVCADVLLCSADGGHKTSTLSLPFLFPIDATGAQVEAEGIVCGLNIRRKKDGETEAEATLKLCLRSYEACRWEYVSEACEGEAFDEDTAALSVYALRAGEELWEVAKRLRRMPQELQKSNPELEFPVKEGQRVFIYRQIK